MLVQVLISLFGLLLVNRILSLLEKFHLLSVDQSRKLHILLSLPLLIFSFFKELLTANIILIGIFSIILILSPKIIQFLRQKTFEKLFLVVLQQILLSISHGQSPTSSLKSALERLNLFEQSCFSELFIFLQHPQQKFSGLKGLKKTYINELCEILLSSQQIKLQLNRFRLTLLLQFKITTRSRQIKQQTQLQALLCSIIYVFMIYLATNDLQLRYSDPIFVLSLGLFTCGQILIFSSGRPHQWKT